MFGIKYQHKNDGTRHDKLRDITGRQVFSRPNLVYSARATPRRTYDGPRVLVSTRTCTLTRAYERIFIVAIAGHSFRAGANNPSASSRQADGRRSAHVPAKTVQIARRATWRRPTGPGTVFSRSSRACDEGLVSDFRCTTTHACRPCTSNGSHVLSLTDAISGRSHTRFHDRSSSVRPTRAGDERSWQSSKRADSKVLRNNRRPVQQRPVRIASDEILTNSYVHKRALYRFMTFF